MTSDAPYQCGVSALVTVVPLLGTRGLGPGLGIPRRYSKSENSTKKIKCDAWHGVLGSYFPVAASDWDVWSEYAVMRNKRVMMSR